MKIKFLISVMLVFLFGSSGTILAFIQTGGQWHFNDGSGMTATDSLGFSNNGTLQNMEEVDWRSDSPPEGTYYLRFDGVDEYVEITDDTDSELDITTNLTLEAYIRRADGITSQETIIRKDNAYWLRIMGNDVISFAISISGWQYLDGNIDVADGNWHHVAGTYRPGNGGMQIWVDRAVDTQNPDQTGSVDTNNSALRIGAASASQYQFTGDIDYPQVLNYFDTSLPVTLSSFTAIPIDSGIKLTWRTESEVGNIGFNIYRSEKKDGKFIKLNKELIPGAGNSAMPNDYQFTDKTAIKGKQYYYYLEDVNVFGLANKSSIISINKGLKRLTTTWCRIKRG